MSKVRDERGLYATRDEKASRFDIISLAIAVMSLAVSGAAGVVGYKAWTRPAPADPTCIPSFGQSDNPETIDGGEGGRRFFEFLDKYQDLKIRIVARVVDDDQVTIQDDGGGVSTYFSIHRKCPQGRNASQRMIRSISMALVQTSLA